ncbi:hypothetical protein LX32DRAFT_436137 [Colletotrichum zoysiae]|uniref:Uncharacterized protein n=1 Tax=Colletotrichum zoysiae TaxID=1216348 RepID=A0AAD9HFW4_9PEZI|nr:hypothetical protein LX32DRAFT_436137 [Colletotrichum zoysiae]
MGAIWLSTVHGYVPTDTGRQVLRRCRYGTDSPDKRHYAVAVAVAVAVASDGTAISHCAGTDRTTATDSRAVLQTLFLLRPFSTGWRVRPGDCGASGSRSPQIAWAALVGQWPWCHLKPLANGSAEWPAPRYPPTVRHPLNVISRVRPSRPWRASGARARVLENEDKGGRGPASGPSLRHSPHWIRVLMSKADLTVLSGPFG